MRLDDVIKLALEEDIRHGDVTAENLGINGKSCKAAFIAKDNGILAGIDIVNQVFESIDPALEVKCLLHDGDEIREQDRIAEVSGNALSILKAERVALNFLQRMCGISTLTNKMVKKIEHTGCKLLDTRKTTPLLRALEKYAVRIGGGYNHRFGLYDMVMLKENHIRAVGGIRQAVSQIRFQTNSYKIEVEVTNLHELQEAANCNVDRIMLDNMSLEDMEKAVKMIKGKIELEASGNINLQTIQRIAETGVDFISSGAITHSYQSFDISLLFEELA